MAAKTLKNSYCWQTVNTVTESYVFSGFGVGIFRGLEWKSTTVGKDKVNKWEFRKLKITTIVVFVIMIQRIFSS